MSKMRTTLRWLSRAGHLGFPDGAAARELLLRLGEVRPEDLLDRHVPVQQLVAAPPDHAHPAPADDRDEPVASGQQASRLSLVHGRPTTRRRSEANDLPGNCDATGVTRYATWSGTVDSTSRGAPRARRGAGLRRGANDEPGRQAGERDGGEQVAVVEVGERDRDHQQRHRGDPGQHRRAARRPVQPDRAQLDRPQRPDRPPPRARVRAAPPRPTPTAGRPGRPGRSARAAARR